jgi:hypothetical protein
MTVFEYRTGKGVRFVKVFTSLSDMTDRKSQKVTEESKSDYSIAEVR